MKKKFFILILLILPITSHAQYMDVYNGAFSMEGTIFDRKTKLPIVDTTFYFDAFASGWQVTTDSLGRYKVGFYEVGLVEGQICEGCEDYIRVTYRGDWDNLKTCRYLDIPLKKIKINKRGLNGPPTVHWDIKI